MKLFIITVITVLLASPAFAQSVSFDSALHDAGSSPGVTITAPLTDGGLVDLTGHIGRVDLESDVRGDATAVASQIGIRFNAPEVFRVRPYVITGLEQIGGSVGYDDVLALNLQPGFDVRIMEAWGIGFKTPSVRAVHLIDRTNPYSVKTQAVFYLFGRW